MTVQIETTIRTCDWRLDGRCYRRMKRRQGAADRESASPGLGKPPTVPDLLDVFRGKGSVEEIPECDAAPGTPCPHLPVFDGLVLSFRGEVVLLYERRCRQTKLLRALQMQGWPEFIEDQSSDDAQHGLRDIVVDFNERQQSRQRFHFWCEGRRLFWKISGDEPAKN